MDGLEMAEQIKNINSDQNILIVSAYSDATHFTQSIKLGIDGYIIKPIDFTQLNSVLFKICFKIKQFKDNKLYKENLEKLVEEKSRDVQELEHEKVLNYKKTLYALVKMIEDRDTYTGGHSFRVATYSKNIAQHLGYDGKKCENIYQAGILHDIGKIAIPDNILLKPNQLEELEYTIIKEHVDMGVNILRKIPMFQELVKYIKSHHERLDGSGYPEGLKGDEILDEAQILAVSDAFDAMTTNRIYKGRKSIQDALAEISSLKGIHFRDKIVDAACVVLKDIIIDEEITQLPHSSIEKERFAYFYRDQITQSYNSQYLDLVLIKNNEEYKFKYLYQISFHHLEQYNKKYGWQKGNELLKNLCELLKEHYHTEDIFRIFSDDFIILSSTSLNISKEEITSTIGIKEISVELKEFHLIDNKISSVHDLELLQGKI